MDPDLQTTKSDGNLLVGTDGQEEWIEKNGRSKFRDSYLE